MTEKTNLLPLEILIKIFYYRHKRQQLGLVCKAWYIAAVHHYGEPTDFHVRETSLDSFSKDLKLYPSLSEKVRVLQIYVDGHGHSPSMMLENLGSILESCTSLIYFKFRACDILCSDIIKTVIDSPLHLPEIQKFKITNYQPFVRPCIDAMYITVKLASKLHRSLTHLCLQIDSMYCVQALEAISGLSQLLGVMPCLKHVNIKNVYPRKYSLKLDIIPLLLSASSLETVIIRNLVLKSDTYSTLNTNSFSSVQMLRLQVKKLHPDIIQFVMMKFNNLQDIEICAKSGLMSSGIADIVQVLNEFRVYCNRILSVNVKFKYMQTQFFIQRP